MLDALNNSIQSDPKYEKPLNLRANLLFKMNKFEILEVIGEGAYGIVLKCRNKENNEIGFIFY